MKNSMHWMAWAIIGGMGWAGCHGKPPEERPCHVWNVAFLDGSVPVEGVCSVWASGHTSEGWTVALDSLIALFPLVEGAGSWDDSADAVTISAEHPSGLQVSSSRVALHICGDRLIELPTPTRLEFRKALPERSTVRWHGKRSESDAPPTLADWLDGREPDVLVMQSAGGIGTGNLDVVFPVGLSEWPVHMQWFRWTAETGTVPSHTQTFIVPASAAGSTFTFTF